MLSYVMVCWNMVQYCGISDICSEFCFHDWLIFLPQKYVLSRNSILSVLLSYRSHLFYLSHLITIHWNLRSLCDFLLINVRYTIPCLGNHIVDNSVLHMHGTTNWETYCILSCILCYGMFQYGAILWYQWYMFRILFSWLVNISSAEIRPK